MKKYIVLFLFSMLFLNSYSQETYFSGYIFDSEHKDQLKDVFISIYQNDQLVSDKNKTDYEGKFKIMLPNTGTYKVNFDREAYHNKTMTIDLKDGQLISQAIPMIHQAGVEFTGLLREYSPEDVLPGIGITNTKIEVYNKNTKKQELTVEQAAPDFVYHFKKKNHYIVQVKKKGYYTKRFEAVIDWDGCTVCLHGIEMDNLAGVFDNHDEEEPLSSSITGRIPLRKINLNEIIEIENIYYNYDKATIKKTAEPALNNIVDIMKTTPIIIELSAHTDSRGDDIYNQKLSQERAQSAVDYIVSRGISRDRITANGYGESKLVNECGNDVECSEEKHQKNRRTEFKVVRLMEQGFDGDKTLKEIIEMDVVGK